MQRKYKEGSSRQKMHATYQPKQDFNKQKCKFLRTKSSNFLFFNSRDEHFFRQTSKMTWVPCFYMNRYCYSMNQHKDRKVIWNSPCKHCSLAAKYQNVQPVLCFQEDQISSRHNYQRKTIKQTEKERKHL